MTVSKYVEVNAQKFLYGLGVILNNEKLIDDIMNDEHYILRVSDDAIQVCYPEDDVIMPSIN